MSVSTATSAPELLQIGEEMESSMYRRPRYPIAMERMYSMETGRYMRRISQVMPTLPMKIS